MILYKIKKIIDSLIMCFAILPEKDRTRNQNLLTYFPVTRYVPVKVTKEKRKEARDQCP